jgi:uncharacterized membrane protein HdeD (DUF308 family)
MRARSRRPSNWTRITAAGGWCWEVSVVYGGLLVFAPMIGAVVLTWWMGAYALVFGIMLLVAAFRLRAKFQASPVGKLTQA